MTSIVEIYRQNKGFILDKNISQLLSFTGDGKLRNDNQTSQEFRELISILPAESLVQYANECLENKFIDSGLVLQDIVNQVGERLGFNVKYGLYQGSKKTIGYDGIWSLNNQVEIIIEVKTTDAYRINLDHIYNYKRKLINNQEISEDTSFLIVVGRKDTGDLEAQIRGSRYGWDFRLISVDSLLKLLIIKNSLNEEKTIQRISEVLRPLEFTRLDKLIEIVFEASQDTKWDSVDDCQEDVTDLNENISAKSLDKASQKEKKNKPVHFQEQCIQIVESNLGINFVKANRSCYQSTDKSVGLLCSISKQHLQKSYVKYWFAFHPHQQMFLEKFDTAYIVYGCGSEKNTFLIPFSIFKKHINHLWTTEKDGRQYWHIVILERDGKFEWQIPATETYFVDLSAYQLKH